MRQEVGDLEDEIAWRDQLLEHLLTLDPDAVERSCRLLLRRAGFMHTEVTARLVMVDLTE